MVEKDLIVFTLKEVVKPGAGSIRKLVVSQKMTANERYPDLPSVFATAEMIFAMECAAADAIKDVLPTGYVSVGTLVNITHLAATPVGETVIASAQVSQVDDKTITFSCEARDEHAVIGKGEHQRGVVRLDKFLEKMSLR